MDDRQLNEETDWEHQLRQDAERARYDDQPDPHDQPETPEDPHDRLNYLRAQIEAENISWWEIAELQGLADLIPEDDLLLRAWAGIEEDTL